MSSQNQDFEVSRVTLHPYAVQFHALPALSPLPFAVITPIGAPRRTFLPATRTPLEAGFTFSRPEPGSGLHTGRLLPGSLGNGLLWRILRRLVGCCPGRFAQGVEFSRPVNGSARVRRADLTTRRLYLYIRARERGWEDSRSDLGSRPLPPPPRASWGVYKGV